MDKTKEKPLRKSVRFHLSRPAEAYAYKTLKESDSAALIATSAVCVFLACFKQGPYAQIEILKKAIGYEDRGIKDVKIQRVLEAMPDTGKDVKLVGFKFNPLRPDHRYVHRVLSSINNPTGFLTEAILVYQALFGMGPYAGVLVGRSEPLPVPAEFHKADDNSDNRKPGESEVRDTGESVSENKPEPAAEVIDQDALELTEEEIGSLAAFFSGV